MILAANAELSQPFDSPQCEIKTPRETTEHQQLKALAFEWAIKQGFQCGGFEISLPQCGFRADVAAYRSASAIQNVEFEGKVLRQRHATIGTTAIFECKQARADLFKDSCHAARAREQLARLQSRRCTIERLLKGHYPNAVAGDSLFQEYDGFDFTTVRHDGHAKLLQKIVALQNAILRKNKFEKLIRYRCANLFYLVTSKNILTNYESPLSWGLLVKENEELVLVKKPAWIPASDGARLSVLQRIAGGRTPVNREKKLKDGCRPPGILNQHSFGL